MNAYGRHIAKRVVPRVAWVRGLSMVVFGIGVWCWHGLPSESGTWVPALSAGGVNQHRRFGHHCGVLGGRTSRLGPRGSARATSQSPKVLESCGLVKTEKVGRTRMCGIEKHAKTAAEQ